MAKVILEWQTWDRHTQPHEDCFWHTKPNVRDFCQSVMTLKSHLTQRANFLICRMNLIIVVCHLKGCCAVETGFGILQTCLCVCDRNNLLPLSPSLKGGQVNDHLPSQSSGSEKTKQGGRDKNTELPLCFRIIYYQLLKVPSWAGKMDKYEEPSLDLQNPCKSWAAGQEWQSPVIWILRRQKQEILGASWTSRNQGIPCLFQGPGSINKLENRRYPMLSPSLYTFLDGHPHTCTCVNTHMHIYTCTETKRKVPEMMTFQYANWTGTWGPVPCSTFVSQMKPTSWERGKQLENPCIHELPQSFPGWPVSGKSLGSKETPNFEWIASHFFKKKIHQNWKDKNIKKMVTSHLFCSNTIY